MHAVIYDRFGGSEVLRLDQLEPGVLGKGELRVRVRAASLNPIDYKMRSGVMPLPFLLPRVVGLDFAGEVLEVGSGVTGFKVGDRVCGATPPFKKRNGACAEELVTLASRTALLPEAVSFEQGAALPTAAVTALQCVEELGRVQPGQRVLVQGGSGGVGHLMIQLARSAGATVVTTCSPRNFDLVQRLGAHETLDYREQGWRQQTYAVVLDAAGLLSWGDVAELLEKGGVLVGTQPRPALMLSKPLAFLQGKRIEMIMAEVSTARLERLLAQVQVGALEVVVGARHRLEETGQALDRLEKGGQFPGKLVIEVRG